MKYTGEILGFHYDIEKKDDAEFKIWLKAKLERYVFTEPVLEVIKDILGTDKL